MPPHLALLLGAAFILYTLRNEKRRGLLAPGSLFWPTLWYMVVSTKPVGIWFSIWGLPVLGGGSDGGGTTEQVFYGSLTLIGIRILIQRRFDWASVLRANPWLTAFLAFMAVSFLWSAFPFISFKRYIKVIGSIVMALVVLTNERPLESILTVLRRCLYLHLPMSIICIKYFREIGVSFDWHGSSVSWQGLSTSKNTLGQVAMLGAVYFAWEVRRLWTNYRWKTLNTLYLGMAIYLLKGSEDAVSLTSLMVTVFALSLFFGMHWLRRDRHGLRRFVSLAFSSTLGLIGLVLIHSVVIFSEESLFGRLITTFGRDITLTDRTYIWSDVYAATTNPIVGIGFGAFWIDRIANIPWNASMTWVLGQGHSGYVDLYLQLGLVGAFLFAGLVFTTYRRLRAALNTDFDYGCFRLTLFITILFVNITETTFLRGDHHLWFVMLLVLWFVPATELRRSVTVGALPGVNEPAPWHLGAPVHSR